MKIIRSLYKWVLHWANTPRGLVALFFLAFAESSFFPIPPDVLLIALCLGRPKRALFYALICTSASVLGGMFGYLIGHEFWHLSNDFFLRHIFSEATFFRVQELYQQNAFLSIFVSGFTPIPYKVFTITAGVFDIPFGTFTFASTLGRGLRFFLVAGALMFFGGKIKDTIERYFGFFTILFTLLLIGGFFLIKWLAH